MLIFKMLLVKSIGVRVVKEVDLSPTGVMPRRFESCPMHYASVAQLDRAVDF